MTRLEFDEIPEKIMLMFVRHNTDNSLTYSAVEYIKDELHFGFGRAVGIDDARFCSSSVSELYFKLCMVNQEKSAFARNHFNNLNQFFICAGSVQFVPLKKLKEMIDETR